MVKYTIHLSIHEVKENGQVDELEREGDTLDFATSSWAVVCDLQSLLFDKGDSYLDGRAHCYPIEVTTHG